MDSASHFLTADHRACDARWLAVEGAAHAGNAAAATGAWTLFAGAMERHFAFEEEVLFPALDHATGMHGAGPTAVMRHEHAQMRRLLATMAAAVAQGAWDTLMDQGDTLLLLIGQHNLKEEHILYPLADARLASDWPGLAARWPVSD
ncbi:MAG: hemerythrin domain-containing protein [Deltaproteobacteria bacterium]|nr:hemerythrin domain-containing protein [Deltaproteobacteria bacterium]